MTLIPSLLAILLFGILPLGNIFASLLANWLHLPQWVCMIILYVGLIALGTTVLSILRHFYSPDTGQEHDRFRLGDGRGQRFLNPLLGVTVCVGILAIVLTPTDAVSLGCMLGAAVIAVAPDWALRKTSWPLDVPPFIPPVLDDHDDAELPEPVVSGDVISRLFSWTFSQSQDLDRIEQHTLTVRLRRQMVEEYTKREHPLPQQYTTSELSAYLPPYVLDGIIDEVEHCAINLAKMARQREFTYLHLIDFILSFTGGGLEYISDMELYGQQDFWAFPIETLNHQKGDCDDHAILAASLFHTLGIDAILIFVRNPCHLAVGVALKIDRPGRWVRYNNRNYFYAEATGKGNWRLGELPSTIAATPDNLIPIPLVVST